MQNSRPTMKDVAKLAGVSQPAVSYVINGTGNVSEAVRERVNKAIETLNYQPNYLAKALKTQTSNLIGIIVPDIINQYYSRLLQIMEEELRKKHFEIIICSTSYDPAQERSSILHLISFNVYGIVCLYQLMDKACWDLLKSYHKPTVAIEGGSYCASVGIPSINVDSHLGGYMATRHLLGLGRKRIAYIHQNSDNEALEQRMGGYIEAMKSAGLYRAENIFITQTPNNKWAEGTVLGKRLAIMPFDGIITSSDIIAVGIIRELLSFGRDVPNDVAVVGYDNVTISELFIPALTTIAQPVNEMCALAVNTLLTISGNSAPSAIPTLQPILIRRDST